MTTTTPIPEHSTPGSPAIWDEDYNIEIDTDLRVPPRFLRKYTLRTVPPRLAF